MPTNTKPTKQPDKTAKLAALMKHLKTADIGAGNSSFLDLKDGRNIVRILPEVGEMEFFYQPVGVHYMGKNRVYCPAFTTEGQRDCPICELVSNLYRAGDPASKKIASKIRVTKRFWMNAIDRSNEKAGALILTIGPMVFGAVANLINDPEYGSVYDIENGTDIIIEKSGSGIDTEYQTTPRRNASYMLVYNKDTAPDDDSVGQPDYDRAQEILDSAKDLTPIEVTADPEEDRELTEGHVLWILPYDRIVEENHLDDLDEMVEAMEGEDEDEAPKRTPSRKPAASAKKPVKRIVEEDEEEEDEEDIEDADDEQEEPPAKREVARRLAARKSSRR